MYLKASKPPKFDPAVKPLQIKLNAIRIQVHGNWPHLQEDGKFGPITELAVKGYQTYRNITPVSGEVGDTTLRYIEESYNSISQWRNPDSNTRLHKTEKTNIDWKSIARNFGDQFTNTINGISKDAEGQLKNFKSRKVTPQDVEKLARSLFSRPDVTAMRKTIEDSVFKELEKTAHGNTNVYNTPNNRHKVNKAWQIGEAQRQVQKGVLNPQNKNLVEKRLAEQLLNKVTAELESANFSNRITNSLRSKGVPKVTGGFILTTISILPVSWHFCVCIDAWLNGKPNASEALNTVVADFIQLIEGALIGAVISLIVGVVGLTGGVAVLVVLIISIIVGIILEVFFPDHSKWLADKVISATTALVSNPVFQESARTSFV